MQLIVNEKLDNGMLHLVGLCDSVCSQMMDVLIKEDTVVKVQIVGGCRGNTQGVSRLAEGQKIGSIISRLKGIDCQGGTSCPDQLAQLLEAINK